MEREPWPPLYHLLRDAATDFRQKYVPYQPGVLVAVLLGAALHDRPVSWACPKRHRSTTTLKPYRLPAPSTLSRRLDAVGVALLGRALGQRVRDSGLPAWVAYVGGKPLPVGGWSKDPDARCGRGAGATANGYLLHAAWSTRAVPEAGEGTPRNANEKAVARALVGQLHSGGYLLADGNSDASDVFDAAFAAGYQLVVPLPAGANPGSGKHYQSPHRLRSIALPRGDFGRARYKARAAIERSFGNATSLGGGLGPLPAWVRGLPRVRTWVWAKLLINAVRILRK